MYANQKRPSNTLNIVIGVLIFLLITALVVIIAFGFMQLKQTKESAERVESQLASTKSQLEDMTTQNANLRAQLVTVQAETQAQTQDRILKEVASQYKVPNEKPSFAQVKDAEQLAAQQPFFKDTQNGDYLVMYPKAKLTILYRPSEKKIINTGPIEVKQ